jgi:hypothetical protein
LNNAKLDVKLNYLSVLMMCSFINLSQDDKARLKSTDGWKARFRFRHQNPNTQTVL